MRAFFFALVLMVAGPVCAAIDTYEFHDDEAREQFQQLTQELRCPKCQNQNLADSNSPIASDLRREVYRMVESGDSNDQIVDFMVARYGEFVLYRPKVNEATYVLWYGPFVLLAIGMVVVVLLARARRSKETNASDSANLSHDEQARLSELLKDNNGESK